ncbi:MAG UNVERIFIED_CONTAM: hypothetical protein LVR18_45790 [Planctomycetaceae bacterium]
MPAPASDEEWNTLLLWANDNLDHSDDMRYWIGYGIHENVGWFLIPPDLEEVTSFNWDDGEPNNDGEEENFVEIYDDGVWNDQDNNEEADGYFWSEFIPPETVDIVETWTDYTYDWTSKDTRSAIVD